MNEYTSEYPVSTRASSPDSSAAGWLSLELEVPSDRAEPAEDGLFELGASSITLLDAADHPLHEPGPGQMPIWPRVVLRALFAPDSSRDQLVAALSKAEIIESAAQVQFSELAECDWERAWMDRFQPMHFGHGLWICPSHIAPDPGWPQVIRLDPGLAFGSGTHPTTALCLEWIAAQAAGLERVVDFGCGSGVLAIAAARMGAGEILAIDHDPQALIATIDNARRNDVADRIQTATPEQFDQLRSGAGTCQLVVANILAQPLVELAPTLSRLVAPGRHLVLSGILSEQADRVAKAYRALDPAPDRAIRDGWVRLVLQRRPA